MAQRKLTTGSVPGAELDETQRLLEALSVRLRRLDPNESLSGDERDSLLSEISLTIGGIDDYQANRTLVLPLRHQKGATKTDVLGNEFTAGGPGERRGPDGGRLAWGSDSARPLELEAPDDREIDTESIYQLCLCGLSPGVCAIHF